ncbi:MAG: SDR family oxidoreductase [Pleurocapsa sp. MO_192.B19]|nr:SDR family oxidoreductase [Pleurocapsa sp. MO_192.B19]
MSNFSRRKAISLGAVGTAGVAATILTQGKQNQVQSEPLSQPEVNPDGRFADRVVLITGATSGIGEATARAFAAEGATVHFCGRREQLGQQVAQSITDAGGKATYQKADVRIEDEVRAFVDSCIQSYGKIDIAFNNAGIVNPKAVPLAEQSLEDWQNVMTTNATGYFLAMKYEIPHLLKNEPGGNYGTRGVIVNNASVSAHIGFPGISPYSSSKHAVVGMTKCAALEYGKQGIRINSISPGAVNTPMRRTAYENQGLPQGDPLPDPPNIVNRANTPEEMADIVMLLASSDISYILGTDIDVTTGMLTGLLTV